eukprot:2620686-Pyramimonas_sp.AAC.1
MHSASLNHWGPVFAAKTVSNSAVSECLDNVFPRRPLLDPPLPGEEELLRAARRAGDSAPGPDGLPYRAWIRTPGAISILANLSDHMVHHGAPLDLNYAEMAMLPKGDEPMGNVECTRTLATLRPLSMGNSA